MEPVELARGYYEAIDGDDYEALAELLASDFVQVRGDRTFESREAFVRFMRDDRPTKDTTHDLTHVTADGERVVVEGALLDAAGDELFRFADAFEVEAGRLAFLRTYSQ